MELARFIHDTYHRRYKGAEVLWEIMQATATGRRRINKYAPQNVFAGGKTGTYDGPNASPATVKLKSIRARNHVVNLKIDDKSYGLAILSNTGSGEDGRRPNAGISRRRTDCCLSVKIRGQLPARSAYSPERGVI